MVCKTTLKLTGIQSVVHFDLRPLLVLWSNESKNDVVGTGSLSRSLIESQGQRSKIKHSGHS